MPFGETQLTGQCGLLSAALFYKNYDVNTLQAPHHEMSPKHFTVAAT